MTTPILQPQSEAAVRVVALNIRSAGAARAGAIALALETLGTDVAVLTETLRASPVQPVLEALRAIGLTFHATADSDTPRRSSAVAIASRTRLDAVRQPLLGANRQRVLEAGVQGALISGAYFPHKKPKVAFWRDEFLPYARARLEDDVLLVGDWNSGSHLIDEAGSTLYGAAEFEQMTAMGWADLWRSRHAHGREFTWYSRSGNGFRLDHAFASPTLASRVSSASYDHSIRERNISDHSAMVIDVD